MSIIETIEKFPTVKVSHAMECLNLLDSELVEYSLKMGGLGKEGPFTDGGSSYDMTRPIYDGAEGGKGMYYYILGDVRFSPDLTAELSISVLTSEGGLAPIAGSISKVWSKKISLLGNPGDFPKETIREGLREILWNANRVRCDLEYGVPVVGGPATIHHYSDSHACTVSAVSPSGKKVSIRRDKAELINGFQSGRADALQFTPGGFLGHTTGHQRYAYSPNPEGVVYTITRRDSEDGSYVWKEKGVSLRSRGGSVQFKSRSEHYDYNF